MLVKLVDFCIDFQVELMLMQLKRAKKRADTYDIELAMGMMDEALSILLLLASHPEGQNAMGRLSFIETLVEIIEDGTPKNKECATSVLLELALNNSSVTLAALQYGVYEHLVKLARCGSNRGQRKANSLLQQMSKFEHIPQHFIQNNWICS